MPTRTALLLSAAALLGTASPALAGDDRHAAAAYDQPVEWQQNEVAQQWADDAYNGEPDAVVMRDMPRSSAPRLAYSLEERQAWLADCRIVMRGQDYYYDDARYEDDDDTGLIGGLLGAVVGGVAGNRIGGSGDRLAGTLIGAGVGGIAGAVIGSAIGNSEDARRDDHRNAGDAWASDYCEAYLRRYEASGQAGHGQMAYAQPTMAMRAPARQGAMREIVREEWVDVPVDDAEGPTHQAAPDQGKLISTD